MNLLTPMTLTPSLLTNQDMMNTNTPPNLTPASALNPPKTALSLRRAVKKATRWWRVFTSQRCMCFKVFLSLNIQRWCKQTERRSTKTFSHLVPTSLPWVSKRESRSGRTVQTITTALHSLRCTLTEWSHPSLACRFPHTIWISLFIVEFPKPPFYD